MTKSDIENEIRGIASKVAGDLGLDLVHVELAGAGKNTAVRVLIDKPGGITHEDCSSVSHAIEAVLGSHDPDNSRYVLEVSSPGIERGLYCTDDFRKFAGRPARFKTGRAIEGQRNFRGKILDVENDDIVFEDRSSGIVRVHWHDIAKANLEFDLGGELKKAKKRGS